jgi:LmbE family N-acetylglucosaminyl deacetylase
MRVWRTAQSLVLIVFAIAPRLAAQDRGAVQLHRLVNGLTVTPRVLIIGAHPDDDDLQLIAWLARGRMVETGYLSLTRGEAGDNFIGNEGGVALGAIRTEECSPRVASTAACRFHSRVRLRRLEERRRGVQALAARFTGGRHRYGHPIVSATRAHRGLFRLAV